MHCHYARTMQIRTDGATLVVEHAPGHWQNHAVFYLQEERAVFSGDHVLGFGTTQLLDLYDYMTTLRRLMAYTPSVLYPGWSVVCVTGFGFVTVLPS